MFYGQSQLGVTRKLRWMFAVEFGATKSIRACPSIKKKPAIIRARWRSSMPANLITGSTNFRERRRSVKSCSVVEKAGLRCPAYGTVRLAVPIDLKVIHNGNVVLEKNLSPKKR